MSNWQTACVTIPPVAKAPVMNAAQMVIVSFIMCFVFVCFLSALLVFGKPVECIATGVLAKGLVTLFWAKLTAAPATLARGK